MLITVNTWLGKTVKIKHFWYH